MTALRFVIVGLLLLALRLDAATPAPEEPPLPAGRLVVTIEGVRCEFSPGQEELARLVGLRIAEHNREATAALAAAKGRAASTAPLSPADMRTNRARYLEAICAQLALKKPTAWQEECYDAFLGSYERTITLLGEMWNAVEKSGASVNRISLWNRGELVRRLEAGEKLTGFTYDPVTKQGGITFNLPQVDFDNAALKAIQARMENLKHEYKFRMTPVEDGKATTYSASVSTQPAKAVDAPPEKKPEEPALLALPLVVPEDFADRPATEQADVVWERMAQGVFTNLAEFSQRIPNADVNIAYLILHETTEIGIVDHYYRGRDRRWFCDGVANYVPWRVVRDLHGVAAANQIYDVRAQLAKYADLRQQADLRKWPAVENQDEAEQESQLNRARYAFAAQAVFLMNQRAGEDILPKLFAEIGRTAPEKVSMKTVEKAWTKVAKLKLDAILAEAVQPLPNPAK